MAVAQASSVAQVLAPMTGVWTRLLADHVADADDRCSACRWQTRAADAWPCDLYLIADAARRISAVSRGSVIVRIAPW